MQFQHILFPEVSNGNDASGFAMKDWNVVITVNDSDSFLKARREFQRFGYVTPIVLVLRPGTKLRRLSYGEVICSEFGPPLSRARILLIWARNRGSWAVQSVSH